MDFVDCDSVIIMLNAYFIAGNPSEPGMETKTKTEFSFPVEFRIFKPAC